MFSNWACGSVTWFNEWFMDVHLVNLLCLCWLKCCTSYAWFEIKILSLQFFFNLRVLLLRYWKESLIFTILGLWYHMPFVTHRIEFRPFPTRHNNREAKVQAPMQYNGEVWVPQKQTTCQCNPSMSYSNNYMWSVNFDSERSVAEFRDIVFGGKRYPL